MEPPPAPESDAAVVRPALGVALGGLALTALLVVLGPGPGAAASIAPHRSGIAARPATGGSAVGSVADEPAVAASAAEPDAASAAAAGRGAIDERLAYPPCKPPDPVGLGPWSDYEELSLGEILVPQKGGHTDDFGFDVLVHFHGHEAARKTVVQVSRGIVFVGVDLGTGSGAYSAAFPTKREFEAFRQEIVAALRKHSGDERAHIRHLALSAWSAGYGAITEILAHRAEGVDAVVLLDGLHAAWKRGPVPAPRAEDLSDRTVRPVIDYARRALGGHGLFLFTHSEIEPPTYPGTGPTADLLLAALGTPRSRVDDHGDPFGLVSRAEQAGVLVQGYRGKDAAAHCAQVAHLGPLLRDRIEQLWDTPLLDRAVPAKGPPPRDRPGASRRRGADLDGIELRLRGPEPDPAAGPGFDTGGLEPEPLGPSPGQVAEP